MLSVGDTFYACDDEEVEPHLKVIITSPHNGEVITVSITSKRHKSEMLTVLRVGDHPFIKWDSVVSYRYSCIRKIADIETSIKAGIALRREPMAAPLVKRFRAGLRDSEHTPNGVLRFFLDLSIDDD